MSTPARGPQPVTRRDGITAYSSGTVHTWWIRAADLLRRPAQNATAPAAEPVYASNGNDLYQRAIQAASTRR
jgi:hypothetical protein